jgi:hypothetical protein
MYFNEEQTLKNTKINPLNRSPKLVSKLLKISTSESLLKALNHLEYSYKKVIKNKLTEKLDWTEEELETLESFSSRFSRASDLFLSKYLRILVLEGDPAFRGTFIDTLNMAEKIGWISSTKQWVRVRELRNVAAHEYTQDDLQSLFQEIVQLTVLVLSIRSKL